MFNLQRLQNHILVIPAPIFFLDISPFIHIKSHILLEVPQGTRNVYKTGSEVYDLAQLC